MLGLIDEYYEYYMNITEQIIRFVTVNVHKSF